jgi:hypothetical protein
MSSSTRLSDCARPACSLARSSIALPFPHDVDVAPQLVVISLAQSALAATHRALDSAHPVLGIPPRANWDPQLTDTEYLAVLILHASDQLSTLLRDYEAAVVHDNGAHNLPQFPF